MTPPSFAHIPNQPYPCGHPNVAENTIRVNAYATGCRECRCEQSRISGRMKGPRITARNAEIMRRRQRGESTQRIAADLGLSRGNVRTILSQCTKVRRFDHEYTPRALKVAAELAGANVPQLISDWRAPRVLIDARYAVMVALRKRGLSTPRIGEILGGRDHATVLNGLKRAEVLAARSPEFAELLRAVDAA